MAFPRRQGESPTQITLRLSVFGLIVLIGLNPTQVEPVAGTLNCLQLLVDNIIDDFRPILDAVSMFRANYFHQERLLLIHVSKLSRCSGVVPQAEVLQSDRVSV